MAKISIRQIKDSLPPEKNLADSLWTRYILRPISIPVSWIFLRFDIRANTVSYFSGFLCIIAGFMFGWGIFSLAVFGAILFNIFAVLDCVDGNIARVTATTGPYGGWADALGGYVAYIAVLLSLGYAAGGNNASILGLTPEKVTWVLLGGISASANMLMRLAYQSYRNIAPEGIAGAKKTIGLEKILSENLGVTGVLMPALFVGLFLHILGYVLIFYTFFYTLGCILTLIKLIRKVEYASRKK
ncbi:MAG: CDP-alcohol phosphatidyltransferase family protein [Spirochaetia bacterium]|jgi:phosphatidylglycerophosphate synthase|nr:CDP-alcohol phosphatidyltransferase family protein [Spirochaetia bacterium]